MAKFRLGICGGTFDFFHAGHKKFITGVLKSSEEIILGITSDSYIKSFKAKEGIESFAVRKKAVEEFLESFGFENRVEIISINSPYDPLLTKSFDPEVIFVTHQTKNTAEEINKKRKEKSLKALDIKVLPLKRADDGKLISSTRIRSGEINREGRIYTSPKWQNKKLILPLDFRSALQQPLGKILKEIPKGLDSSKVITIGDMTTQKFNKNNAAQFLSIVDFLVHRKKIFKNLSELGFKNDQNSIIVKNPPGTINSQLFEIIRKIFKEKERKVILVEGEEDLTVLAVLLVAPLGYTIFYGQPDQGMVKVNINEENKEKTYKLLEKFTLED